MTDLQKQQVDAMRSQGLGYAKIAGMLSISENTVKSYCRRNSPSANKPKEYCEQCRKPIDKSNRKGKRFCSDACRTKWWNTHPKSTQLYIATCAYCGREFTMRRRNERKYCSRQCYIEGRFGEHHD